MHMDRYAQTQTRQRKTLETKHPIQQKLQEHKPVDLAQKNKLWETHGTAAIFE